MTSKELRKKYIEFFKSKNHKEIPSASLAPENDSTTLFNGSGMQPLISYLSGEKHPAGARLVNSQKCFRTEDIEEVGDQRHNTFFEMLGNWSLGDYFKEKQLSWMFEFLTQELKIDPQRIFVTVFRGNEKIGINRDTESVQIWKKLFAEINIEAKDVDFSEKKSLQDGKIFYYGDEKNWWSRSGAPAKMPVGEIGGPDSEMFYDLGADLKRHENSPFKNQPCHPNCDCGRFIEIGNNVFMEFIKTEKGFEKLSQKNVDFGGGLERLTMVVQNKTNVFETDLFSNIIKKIEELSGKKYCEDKKSFEIVADHLKAALFIMGDDKGIVPSKVDQGYVIRRLIRRAIRYGRQLDIKEKLWIKKIALIVVDDYREIYPELNRNRNKILKEIEKEGEKFEKALEKGLKEFKRIESGIRNQESGIIKASEVFDLYQSYGFPVEMTKELAEEKGLEIDEKGFYEELKKHQELSRTASAGKFKGGLADTGEETVKLHTTAHLLLESLRRVLGDHIFQKGSNINAERLRFDFSHSAKLTDEEKIKVEDLVNKQIQKKLPVRCEEMSLEEAKKINAMGIFENKYGEKVKVYSIGESDDIFSKEICGGPHIKNTSELGKFKIKKEQSSSSGVRRIKAVLE